MISEIGFMEKGEVWKVAKIRNRGTIIVINNKVIFKYEGVRNDINILFDEISNITMEKWRTLKIFLKNNDVYSLSCSLDEIKGRIGVFAPNPVKYLRRKNTALYNSLEILLKEYKEEVIPEVSYCQTCGAKVLDNTGDFCSKCGAKIK